MSINHLTKIDEPKINNIQDDLVQWNFSPQKCFYALKQNLFFIKAHTKNKSQKSTQLNHPKQTHAQAEEPQHIWPNLHQLFQCNPKNEIHHSPLSNFH